MVHRAISISAGLAIIAAIVFYSGNFASGQFIAASPVSTVAEATPASIVEAITDLPVELEVSLLASTELGGLSENGLEFRLERITVSRGESIARQATGDELIYVERGSASLASRHESGTLRTGTWIAFVAGDDYVIEPTGTDGTTLLRVRLEAKTAVGSPVATPVTQPAPDLLVSGFAGRLVSKRGTLFIARVVIPAASDTGEQSLSGPMGLIVEEGSIVTHDKTMPDVEIEPGHGLFLPGYSRFNATNEGDTDAVILIAGLLAPPTGGAVGPTLTPTSTVNLLATARAEATKSAENLAIQTTREADLSQTVIALQTTVAEANADSTKIAATQTAISREAAADASTEAMNKAAAQTEIAGLEATRDAQATELASANALQIAAAATVTALSQELESAHETATNVSEQAVSAAEVASTEVGSLESTVAALQSTVVALETADAKDKSAKATTAALLQTSEADTTAVSQELVLAEATIESQATAIAVTGATNDAQSAAIASAEATIKSQSTAIAAADATINAQSAAIASAEATIETQSAAISAAVATVEAQSEAITSAEATIESQSTTIARESATIDAQSGEIVSAEATIESQSGAIASAEATIEAQAGEIASAEATMTAQARSIATADANAGVLTSEIEAVNATATAQASAAETAEAQNQQALAAVQATADAYAEALAAANATSTAVAAAANQTATAIAAAADQTANANASEVAALNVTIAAQQTEAANTQLDLSTRAVDVFSAEATIVALSTALASKSDVAVSSLNPKYVDLTINVNLDGVLSGDATALAETKSQLDGVLAPYTRCRGGVVLTFGHGTSIGEGTVAAAAINALIQDGYPAIFGGAAFDAFGDLSPELGQVDIRIYFFTGCEAAESEV